MTFLNGFRRALALLLAACLAHNPVFAQYVGIGILFAASGRAAAGAFTDKAAEGQGVGASMLGAFTPAVVNPSTGTLTLKNGQAAGQTVEPSAMFQEMTPGGMAAATAAYGNNNALLGVTAQTQNTLATSTSGQYPYAYQTLMGGRHSSADLSNDPIWAGSDATLSGANGVIDSLFTSCSNTGGTTATTGTAHIPDYKTCIKSTTPQGCEVGRSITVNPATYDIVSSTGAGTASVTACGGNCATVKLSMPAAADGQSSCRSHSHTLVLNLHDPSTVARATVTALAADDNVKLLVNGRTDVDAPGTGCADNEPWSDPAATDITADFKASPTVTLTAVNTASPDTKKPGFSVTIKVDVAPSITEQFFDTPPGCRANLFNHWSAMGTPPAWASSGSAADDASTPYWQCADADYFRTVGGNTISHTVYGPVVQPILPGPPASPPAPICYKAVLRVPTSGSMACWTDTGGIQHCPTIPVQASDNCAALAGNPACGYVGEKCVEGATDPATGSCTSWQDTYDCGTDQPVIGGAAATSSTICGGALRCMGTECVTQALESNPDFGKTTGALSVLNGMQMDSGCKTDTANCEIFKGKQYTCKTALGGYVDCCTTPKLGVSMSDYIDLAYSTWKVADRTGLLDTLATETKGVWRPVSDGVSAGYDAMMQAFTSTTDSLVCEGGGVIDQAATSIAALQGEISTTVTQWAVDAFGPTAVSTLVDFTATTSVAATGEATTTVTAVSGLAEGASAVMGAVAIVGLVYAIVNILVQIIFACEQEEFDLGYKREMKMCHEVGPFCSAKALGGCIEQKDSYCCFNSPLGRIIQEQSRLQLPARQWGDAKSPDCGGLAVGDIQKVDFNRVDLSEWIGILTLANKLPSSAASANSLYSMGAATTSKIPDTPQYSVTDRVGTQFQNADVEAARRQLQQRLQ
jgi:conjugal transfer mating pair stabilization protein TraN